MRSTVRRTVATLGVTATALALMAAPASAHIIKVTNPQTGHVVHEGWVGGMTNFAAHSHGLVQACLSGHGAAAIHTTWNPDSHCTHFGTP